jgi:hypothetical protein
MSPLILLRCVPPHTDLQRLSSGNRTDGYVSLSPILHLNAGKFMECFADAMARGELLAVCCATTCLCYVHSNMGALVSLHAFSF